mmetsp:Transcript_1912/g.3479  ORF Transcript_1912/g.3479 Transcript_1912/m.3479 type:complete len:884 (+) Transcript_1912:3-2654(+)
MGSAIGRPGSGILLPGIGVDDDGRVIRKDLVEHASSLSWVQKSDDAKAALKVLQDMEIDPSDGKVEVKEMEEKLKEWNESSLQGLIKEWKKQHAVIEESKQKTNLENKSTKSTDKDDDNEDDWADEPHPPPAMSEHSEWSDGDGDGGSANNAEDWGEGDGDAWEDGAEGGNSCGGAVDWGDDAEESGTGFGVGDFEDNKQSKDKLKKVLIGKFQILDEAAIKSEVDGLCQTLVEELGVTRGKAIHILRAYKWNKNLSVNKWLDKPKEARLKSGITHPHCDNLPSTSSSKNEPLVLCMAYSGVGSSSEGSSKSKSSPSPRRKSKRTRSSRNSSSTDNIDQGLLDVCKELIEAGSGLQQIISKLRSKYKIPDIMRGYQQIFGSLAAKAMKEPRTLCEEKRGMVPMSEATQLSCGHWRCNTCWKNALDAELSSGRESLMMRCAACNVGDGDKKKSSSSFCYERVPRELFSKFLGEKKTEERYDIWVRRNYVETRIDIQCCPSPGCDLNLRKLGVSDLAQCQCGHEFCFKCLEAPHAPVPCLQFQDFQARSAGEYQQRLWFQMHTMQCPRCKVRIEKNRACLHMTCKCGYDFCWACRQEWTKVNHTYYNCPDYRKIKEGSEIERLQSRAAWELRKYRWYEQQMNASRRDTEEAEKILERVKDDLQGVSAKSRSDYDFLIGAIKDFIRAKKLMVKLYIMAFYFQGKPTVWTCSKCSTKNKLTATKCSFCGGSDRKENAADEKTKLLFEFQQKMMVDVTMSMMRLLNGKWAGWRCGRCNFENDQGALKCTNCSEPAQKETNRVNIRAFLQEKKRVQKVAKTMTSFVDRIVDEIESGKYDAFILDEPDDSIQGWFCIKCKTMNSFDHLICKCTACQVHGELSCLRCQPRG